MERWSTADTALELRLDQRASGEQNMRIDAELLARVERGEGAEATLRFYGWQPAAISLGHHQSTDELDLSWARSDGYDVVRRPTGGGAVLHANEITYAFVARWPRWMQSRRVRESYDLVSSAFVRALRRCGVAAECGGARGSHEPLCFSRSQSHEIHVAGKKLVGSAMRAGRQGFLLHGSILCGPEHRELARYSPRDSAALDATTDLAALGLKSGAQTRVREALAEEIEALWFAQLGAGGEG